jgi:hypothetical protein
MTKWDDIKWNDRTIGIAGLVAGAISIVLGVAALVLAYLVLPWVTQNDHFCYSLTIEEWDEGAPRGLFDPISTVKRVERSCFYTRADCETQRARLEAKPPFEFSYAGLPKVSSQCERGN